ncbi:MAG TPA: YceI family protein [Tepidisphaeraceae bacterium]|jgi:polyisoprenoid-binding protein YceI|nr:YceI family protein [Tepidisphaeraceae bacterium]
MRVKTILALILLTSTFSYGAATTYKIDPVHSFVIFRIKHMDVGHVYGRFNEPNGTITIDDADPSKSSFTLELATQKVDTGVQKRDDHLRSPDFFNARQFPTIKFVSKEVKKTDKGYEITGDLTLHGVTKPITANLEQTGQGSMGPRQIIGFETTVDLKRTDFGMKNMVGPAADDVRLIISLEAGK